MPGSRKGKKHSSSACNVRAIKNKQFENNKVSCICLGLNVQGLNPSPRSKSSWKLPKLKEEIALFHEQGYTVPFLAIAESWLKTEITDTEINIPNYNIFRCDRVKVQHGGVLLYVEHNITIDTSVSFNDDECGAVLCLSKHSRCIIGCVYRPLLPVQLVSTIYYFF